MTAHATREDATRCAAAWLEPGDVVAHGTVKKVERIETQGYRRHVEHVVTFTTGERVRGHRLTFRRTDEDIAGKLAQYGTCGEPMPVIVAH